MCGKPVPMPPQRRGRGRDRCDPCDAVYRRVYFRDAQRRFRYREAVERYKQRVAEWEAWNFNNRQQWEAWERKQQQVNDE